MLKMDKSFKKIIMVFFAALSLVFSAPMGLSHNGEKVINDKVVIAMSHDEHENRKRKMEQQQAEFQRKFDETNRQIAEGNRKIHERNETFEKLFPYIFLLAIIFAVVRIVLKVIGLYIAYKRNQR